MPKKCFESKGELPWSCEGSQARCLLTVIPGFIGYRILQGLLSVLGCCGSCPGIGQVVQVLREGLGAPGLANLQSICRFFRYQPSSKLGQTMASPKAFGLLVMADL